MTCKCNCKACYDLHAKEKAFQDWNSDYHINCLYNVDD